MKNKLQIFGYILLVLILTQLIVMVGCGKNPLLSMLDTKTVGSGNLTVQVMKF